MALIRNCGKQDVKSKAVSVLVRLFIIVGLLVIMVGCVSSAVSPLPPEPRLRVATTTSLYDTGLWSYLEPMFEERYSVELDIIYAGTGIALEWGRRDDVDVITVHARAREQQFVAEGYGVRRVPFAYNYFLVVGPAADPAGIKGLSLERAFRNLMETRSGSFISRGDDSGTHFKEKSIWREAGYDYEMVKESGEWYIEAGRGMGPTLLMASEKQAYTLSDTGTFLSYRGGLDLVSIVDNDAALLNVYSIIVINLEKHPKSSMEMANHLVDFLVSPEIQELIGDYGVGEYGIQLFAPGAG